MRLPPVDVYRAPFIEPLGHLVMNAAHAENSLIELCALVNGDGQDADGRRAAYEVAAAKLRNWGAPAQTFVAETLNRIVDADLRTAAIDALAQLEASREDRHRAVHDAVDVGLYEEDGEKWSVAPLRTRYHKSGEREITPVTPRSWQTWPIASTTYGRISSLSSTRFKSSRRRMKRSLLPSRSGLTPFRYPP